MCTYYCVLVCSLVTCVDVFNCYHSQKASLCYPSIAHPSPRSTQQASNSADSGLRIGLCINYGVEKNYVSVQENRAAVVVFVTVPQSVDHLSLLTSLHISYFKETLSLSWLPRS